VWLDAKKTSPFALHQFLLNAEDAMVPQLLRFFTFLEADVIRDLDDAVQTAPGERRGQRVLANEVVALVHGGDAARKAERAGAALFAESIAELDEATLLEVLADAPHATIARSLAQSGVDGVELLVSAGLATSKGEARRFVEQGGVYVNNRRLEGNVTDREALHGKYLVVRRGKRHTCLVELV
jgi:tyrosyl-tRNA synthetase